MQVGNFLSSKGRNVQFIESLADRLERAGWTIYRTSSIASRPLRLANMLATILRRCRQIDVGHVTLFSGPAFIWAEAATLTFRALGLPYIISLHGGNLPVFAARWPRRVRHLLRPAELVISPSRYLKEQLAPYRSDIQLIPNPIEAEGFTYRLRNHPGPKLLWLRAFHSIYDPTMAAQVVAALAKEFPELCLTMIGPDKGDGTRNATATLAQSLGVADRITLVGGVPKSEVPAWMDQGDIFLNTTTIDNTPISVCEAMAAGLCIVSTDVGGLPYLLDHEEDALLVPPNDPDAMTAAVRRILTEPGLAEKLSRNARAKAERFDWANVLPQWESIFARLVATGAYDHGR